MLLLVAYYLIKHALSISLELELLDLNKALRTFDQQIVAFLESPNCVKRDDFLKWFEEYNKHFCQLVSYLNDNDVRAEPIARRIILNGGPSFLKMKIDNDHLKEELFWGDPDMQEMYYRIGVTKVLWFELKNVLSPYGERHLRNINVPWELYELDKRGRLNEDIHFTNTGDIKDPKRNSTSSEV